MRGRCPTFPFCTTPESAPIAPAAITHVAPFRSLNGAAHPTAMHSPTGQQTSPCFTAPCPLCMEERTFYLVETPLGLSHEWMVRGAGCPECGYEALTDDPTERAKLAAAAALWKAREAETEGAEATAKKLEALASEVLTRIRSDGQIWTCPHCGERNGPAFLECWQCQSARPE